MAGDQGHNAKVRECICSGGLRSIENGARSEMSSPTYMALSHDTERRLNINYKSTMKPAIDYAQCCRALLHNHYPILFFAIYKRFRYFLFV